MVMDREFMELTCDWAFHLAAKIKSTDPAKHHRHMVPLIRIQERAALSLRENRVVGVDSELAHELEDIAGDLIREGII